MITEDKVFLYSPDRKILIRKSLEKNFLKLGYKKKNFNLIPRKLRFLLKIFFQCNFIFKNPKSTKIVILDAQTTYFIKKIIPKNSYQILSTRIDQINNIYLTKEIFLFLLKNFFKRSLKKNYLLALIILISPKIIITHIDNSEDFYYLSKSLFKNFKFIAIQNANRGDIIYAKKEKIKKVFIPEYYGFSKFDEHIYKKKKCAVNNFFCIGSLKASLFKEKIKNLKNNIKFDICLISEPFPILNGDYSHVVDVDKIIGQIAEYTFRLCKKHNFNLVFSAKLKKNNLFSRLELPFYKQFLNSYNFKIKNDNDVFSTFKNVMQSKLVIGHTSTILRESIYLKKKVLSCNFSNHPDYIFPSNGICQLRIMKYEEFEKRVLYLLKISNKEYFNKIHHKGTYIMNHKVNTAEFLRKRIRFYLEG
jgi:surface carbohydrate biosynthesis protein